MAFKMPYIPEFPKVQESVIPDLKPLGDPPREIALLDHEEETIRSFMNTFMGTDITKENIFNIFNDFQSDKTKSTKRFFISISSILSLTLFAGVRVTDIDLFGITIVSGMDSIFLVALLVIVLFSFMYYNFLHNHDSEIYKEKIRAIDDAIYIYADTVRKIANIIEKYSIRSHTILFDDFRGMYDKDVSCDEAYEAISFYLTYVKAPHQHHKSIELFEGYGLRALFVLSLMAIMFDFLSWDIIMAYNYLVEEVAKVFF